MSKNTELSQSKVYIQGLLDCSNQIEKIEKDLEMLKIQKLQKVYNQRSKFTSKIPKFWYQVFSIHEDFAEYIPPADTRYFEYLKNLSVEWAAAEPLDTQNSKLTDLGSFKITFEFECDKPDIIDSQIIVKNFKSKTWQDTEKQDENSIGETDHNLISDKVEVKWPSELTKSSKNSKKSFFSIFEWTSVKDQSGPKSCTNINVEDFINLIVGDIFPNADKYFTLAQQDMLIDELNNSDESELELNISDDDNNDDQGDDDNGDDQLLHSKKRKTLD